MIKDLDYACKKHVELFGVEPQIIVAMEECGELIQALAKYYRVRNKFPVGGIIESGDYTIAISQVVEEATDVLILIKQLRRIINIPELWDNWLDKKTAKALDRVNRYSKEGD